MLKPVVVRRKVPQHTMHSHIQPVPNGCIAQAPSLAAEKAAMPGSEMGRPLALETRCRTYDARLGEAPCEHCIQDRRHQGEDCDKQRRVLDTKAVEADRGDFETMMWLALCDERVDPHAHEDGEEPKEGQKHGNSVLSSRHVRTSTGRQRRGGVGG